MTQTTSVPWSKLIFVYTVVFLDVGMHISTTDLCDNTIQLVSAFCFRCFL
jgi:hypothetical protein